MTLEEKQPSKTSEAVSFIKDIIVIIAIVLFVQRFFMIPFMINGQSMASSYYDKEFILVDRISYGIGEPNRGDVIVFKPGVDPRKEFYLKRIIGIPGDNLKIVDGKVYIQKKGAPDFVELQETYLNDNNNGKTYVSKDKTEGKEYIYKVGPGEYFAMGDNRNHSTDSRECFGDCTKSNQFISKKDIIGKVFIDLGYFDFSKLKFIQDLGIETYPRFFSSPATHNYTELN